MGREFEKNIFCPFSLRKPQKTSEKKGIVKEF
jgi:hypothetical protein